MRLSGQPKRAVTGRLWTNHRALIAFATLALTIRLEPEAEAVRTPSPVFGNR